MPTTLLFVGTTNGLAIYRPSADGGRWETAGSTLPAGRVRAIVAADADTLLVAVEGHGGLQSFDGGEIWSASAEIPEPVGTNVMTRNGPMSLINPRLSGATAYARLHGKTPILLGAGAGGALLFRSTDDGIHWEPARMDGGSTSRIVAIVPDPVSANTAWAGSDSGALLRTSDGGQTWQTTTHAPTPILCLAAVEE